MTRLVMISRPLLGILLALSAALLAACGGQAQQEATVNKETLVVTEKTADVEELVEQTAEVRATATAAATSTPLPISVPIAVATQAPIPASSSPTPSPTATVEPQDVQLRIVAINDFHGHIATSSTAFDGVGRADYLASNIAAARAEYEHSVFVSAGDLIGGSPLVSALFHDEPTIEAMNLMGLDLNAVGNHEFDEGPEELVRMQQGGSHPLDGDQDGDSFNGADFQFLAANVIDDSTGDTVFPSYTVLRFNGIGVAFIGLTLEGTANIVARSSVAGLTFEDEAETVNSLIPELRAMGIEATVVLLHQGGFSDGGQDDCGSGLEGAIADVATRLDDAVDLVIAGHTNDEFICEIEGKWVTMADNAGRLFTVIDVSLDPVTKDLAVVKARNLPNSQENITPDVRLTALIEKYESLSAPRANAVIGATTADILRQQNEDGESALGNVIADAHLEATLEAGAVVAFMNQGGIRNDILFATSGPENDGELTYAEAFSVHPFGNSLVTMTLTGHQIDELLELQFRPGEVTTRGILQVSRGFSYEWDGAQPVGSRVDISSITVNGVALDPDANYRVTVNSFLADGGSGFYVLTEGTDRTGGMIDVEAMVSYFAGADVVTPGPQDRIKRLD